MDMYSDSDGDTNNDDGMSGLEEAAPETKTSSARSPNTSTVSPGSPPWIVVDHRNMEDLEGEKLSPVMSMLGCTPSTARILLTHYQWNAEALMGDVVDREVDIVFKEAGAVLPAVADTEGLDSAILCQVCFCSAEPAEATKMECGHAFCNNCWRQHLGVRVHEEGEAVSVRCMASDCFKVCPANKVRALLGPEPELLEQYNMKLLHSYVERNKYCKWCPSVPHCGHAIQVLGSNLVEPLCSCGHRFCFSCGQAPHSPCTCTMWSLWQEKLQGESETLNWMGMNSKRCPKCGNPVEKNGGCNLVICRCGQPFCWLCGQKTGRSHTYSSISGHNCGRWREEATLKSNTASYNYKRYMHYLTQFEGNLQSQKEEDGLIANAEQLLEVGSFNINSHNMSWLKHAFLVLHESRRILANSYAFAYFMFGSMFEAELAPDRLRSLKSLFEDQQECMSTEVERLSRLLEGLFEDFSRLDASSSASEADFSAEMRQLLSERFNIINSSTNIERRLHGLMATIETDLLVPITTGDTSISAYMPATSLSQLQGADLVAKRSCGSGWTSVSVSSWQAPAPSRLLQGTAVVQGRKRGRGSDAGSCGTKARPDDAPDAAVPSASTLEELQLHQRQLMHRLQRRQQQQERRQQQQQQCQQQPQPQPQQLPEAGGATGRAAAASGGEVGMALQQVPAPQRQGAWQQLRQMALRPGRYREERERGANAVAAGDDSGRWARDRVQVPEPDRAQGRLQGRGRGR